MARVRRGAQTWANVPPRGHPASLRGRETVLSVRQKARRRPISAKVREGYVLAPKAAAAAELPSAETARRRRPKLTRSSRQRPPHLAPAFPGSARIRHLPPGGARWGGGCEVWKERRARAGEDARDEAEVRRVIAPRSPSPTRGRLLCDPHLRRVPGAGFPVGGIAPRLREAAALERRTRSQAKSPGRWGTHCLRFPLWVPGDRSASPRGCLGPGCSGVARRTGAVQPATAREGSVGHLCVRVRACARLCAGGRGRGAPPNRGASAG